MKSKNREHIDLIRMSVKFLVALGKIPNDDYINFWSSILENEK